MPATDADRAAFRRRLGVALERARKQLSTYTQEQIGAELNVGRETIGRWESGGGEPQGFELHWMAKLYGVEGDLFLNPPDSITALEVEIARLRRVAVEAGRLAAEDATTRRVGAATRAPRGRRRPRKPAGSG